MHNYLKARMDAHFTSKPVIFFNFHQNRFNFHSGNSILVKTSSFELILPLHDKLMNIMLFLTTDTGIKICNM